MIPELVDSRYPSKPAGTERLMRPVLSLTRSDRSGASHAVSSLRQSFAVRSGTGWDVMISTMTTVTIALDAVAAGQVTWSRQLHGPGVWHLLATQIVAANSPPRLLQSSLLEH
jgi:hypothetical protein